MIGVAAGGSPTRIETIEDVDAMSPAMADGLRGDYVQLEPRPFRARWTTIATGSGVVQFATQETAVLRRVAVPADRYACLIPLRISADARWNGHAVHPDDVVICPPRSTCLAFDPRATQFAIVTVALTDPLALLLAARSDLTGAEPVTLSCPSGAGALHARLERMRDAVERRRGGSGTLNRPAITTYLAFCLAARRSCDRPAIGTGRRTRVVDRAAAFFRHHVSEGVSVSQLSDVVGVSERCLRNAFYDVFTTSPKQYMRLWQLHQVRRVLRRADADASTVTDVATSYGLYELGRFAGAYKSLFGEAPSETLVRTSHRKRRLVIASIGGIF